MDTDDEIVLTMSEQDFNTLREMWMDAYYGAKRKGLREKYRKAINRICHTAETLTLSWLDKKLEEFP